MGELLSNRAIIEVSGDDALKLLQNLVTNDLYHEDYCYTYLLSNQGRYLFDFFIYKEKSDRLLIDVDSSLKDKLILKINLYKLRSNVVIKDLSDEYKVVYSDMRLDNAICSFKDPRFDALGFRSITQEIEDTPRANEELTYEGQFQKELGVARRGAERTLVREHRSSKLRQRQFLKFTEYIGDADLYLEDKYNYAIPDGFVDLVLDRSIPVEFGAEELGAISYTKGCYLGQEIISRTKYQGVVRKKIFKLQSIDGSNLSIGEVLSSGEIVGLACSTYKNMAIALLREERYLALTEKKATLNGNEVVISIPEWRK
jgi:hypothetical protein